MTGLVSSSRCGGFILVFQAKPPWCFHLASRFILYPASWLSFQTAGLVGYLPVASSNRDIAHMRGWPCHLYSAPTLAIHDALLGMKSSARIAHYSYRCCGKDVFPTAERLVAISGSAIVLAFYMARKQPSAMLIRAWQCFTADRRLAVFPGDVRSARQLLLTSQPRTILVSMTGTEWRSRTGQ